MSQLLELLKYIFLGALQGITETLPISSSGHLVIMQALFGFKKGNTLTFEILLHFGSLIAVVLFFHKLLIELFKNFFSYLFKHDPKKQADFKYCWLLIVATIPAGIAGILAKDLIGEQLNNTFSVGIALLVTAILLSTISHLPEGHKKQENMNLVDALFIGLIQVVALIPGISRSGSTISMGLHRKLTLDQALRFSFLMFIPVAIGATLVDFIGMVGEQGFVIEQPLLYFIAFLTSILFTYSALRFFTNILKRGKLIYFSYYCMVAGLLSIGLYFIL
jgi:undecaprenyl-diphosphatase